MNASRTCRPAPVMPPPGDSSGESRQAPETLFECSLLKWPSRCRICPSLPPSTVRLSACIEGHKRRLCPAPSTTPARAHAPIMICASDRKSTRLNSSHDQISYAVFCLKKKKHPCGHHCESDP